MNVNTFELLGLIFVNRLRTKYKPTHILIGQIADKTTHVDCIVVTNTKE